MADIKDEELEVDEVIEEDEILVSYDIAAYPSDLSLNGIKEMWDNGGIVIPEFQRNFVWTIKQSSLLIESFLLGLPVPQVFFYVDENNKNVVIDGQQRILSIIYYLEGYFGTESIHGKRQVFRLQGLDEDNPYHKKRFIDLDEADQRKLKFNSVLRAINIKQLSPKEEYTSVYHIFERLNTGGTPLKPQEIRNCVFLGEFVKILKKLNEDKNWRKVLGKPTFDKHQKDVELILRIFSLSNNWQKYEKPMKEFLNVTMEKEKSGKSSKVKQFVENFPRATDVIIKKLGAKPFHVRGPLNSAVLDSVFCILLDNIDKLPDDIDQRFKKLVGDEEYKETTFYSTSDASVLKKRFEMTQGYLLGK
ncbi:MAG: GmrSD restriction endonuclease domain-containing protein [Planctomycetota bacterium]|jgi:hypothetical protein